MARSADPLRRDSIVQQAQGVNARIASSVTNPALQLAGALGDIEPTASAALQSYAANRRQDATLKAKHDSLVASGAKLADAVRDGTLEPTQNPWYVQAYSRESAAVRGQSSMAQLQLDSASWPEKNDPVAFATRWREEVGKVAGGFNSKDETEGFAPVEAQFTQQALQSNTSQNVSRIVEERKQNLSMLTASGLSQAIQANGGTLTPNQAVAATEPARIQFLATGGSQADWNEMLVTAVTSSAYATHNSGLFDLLHAPELVHGASDGGNTPVGDGASGDASPPLPITPIAPVEPAALVPGKRWASADLKAIIPFGGKFTSGVRSAAHNAEIGGAPGSQHVSGTAIDVVFPPGTSVADVKAHYAQAGAAVDVIHEKAGDAHSTGDHFHIQGARNPVVPPAQPATVASVQAADTPALATAPQAVSPPVVEVRGPSLYDMAGVADKVEADRYRVNQARETAQTERLKALTVQAKVDGTNGYNALYATHGYALLNGTLSSQQLTTELQHAGYTPQAAAQALSLIRGDLQDNAGVATARMALNSGDPGHAKAVMDLATEGLTGGYTPGYADKVGQAVLSGAISGDDGVQMVSRAQSRSNQLESDQRTTTNFNQGQQDRVEGKVKARTYKNLNQTLTNLGGRAAVIFQSNGIPMSQKSRTGINARIKSAAQNHLAMAPDDFAGAHQAARDEMVRVVHEASAVIRAKRGGKRPSSSATSSSSSSSNPRGK